MLKTEGVLKYLSYPVWYSCSANLLLLWWLAQSNPQLGYTRRAPELIGGTNKMHPQLCTGSGSVMPRTCCTCTHARCLSNGKAKLLRRAGMLRKKLKRKFQGRKLYSSAGNGRSWSFSLITPTNPPFHSHAVTLPQYGAFVKGLF